MKGGVSLECGIVQTAFILLYYIEVRCIALALERAAIVLVHECIYVRVTISHKRSEQKER